MKSFYDHVIIGAGPSGMACALSLLKRGAEPLVLEKKVFPRPKTCGGLVTEKTFRLVKTLLGEDCEEEVLFCNQTSQASVYHKAEKLSQASFSTPVRFVRRDVFDHTLVLKYKKQGGCIQESCGAYTVDSKNSRILFEGGREIRYRNLIFADGALSQVRNQGLILKEGMLSQVPNRKSILSDEVPNRIQKRDSIQQEDLLFGLEIFLPAELFPIKEVRLYFGYAEQGYLWAFPYGDEVCVGVETDYRRRTDAQKILVSFLKEQGIETESPHCEGTFLPVGLSRLQKERGFETEALRFKGAFFPAGIPFPQENLEPNVLCVGDAAGLADPISGEGLYFALLSGMAAAKALVNSGNPKQTYLESLKPVFRLLDEGCRLRRLFYQPFAQRWFVRHARGNRAFLTFFFERMVSRYGYAYGKPVGMYLDYKRRGIRRNE